MLRKKLALGLAATLFFVLAGTGVSYAYWSTNASVTSSVAAGAIAVSPNCGNYTLLTDGSFEAPVIPVNSWARIVGTAWQTGDPLGVEYWNNFNSVPAGAGSQHAEINGNLADTLSQVVTTTPGETISWSLLHRGRNGVDGMKVLLGPVFGPGVEQANFADGNTAWGRHSGSYLVPAGQTQTKLSLMAVSSTGGDLSYGNFVDDISVANGPCLLAAPVLTNVSRPGLPPVIGDEVKYTTTVTNKGGSSALSSVFSTAMPTGLTYKPGTITVGGVAKTDAVDGDVAKWSSSLVAAYLGTGATSSAGGTILPGAVTTVTFNATITATVAANLVFTPILTFANPLAPTWAITAAPVSVTIAFIADTIAPSTPGTPVVSGTTATQTTLTWTASTDAVGVAFYDVYRNGTLLASVAWPTLTYTDTSLVGWNSYDYTVKARDAAANNSLPSGSATVSTVPVGLDTTNNFQIRQNSPAYCFQVSSPAAVNSAVLFDHSSCGTASTLRDWHFTPSTNGYVKVNVRASATLVWTMGASTMTLTTAATNTAQEWKVETRGTGFSFESRSVPGSCLTRLSNSTYGLGTCVSTNNDQRWVVSIP